MALRSCPICQEYNLPQARNCLVCGVSLTKKGVYSSPIMDQAKQLISNWET